MNQATDQHRWAIVELMGHQKIAGRYCEQAGLHRIDVPETDADTPGEFRFTRLYAPQAIYSITFVDRAAAFLAAKAIDRPAVTVWELQREINRQARQLTGPVVDSPADAGNEGIDDWDDPPF